MCSRGHIKLILICLLEFMLKSLLHCILDSTKFTLLILISFRFFYDGRGDPDIVFPKYFGPLCPPVDYLLLESQIKDKELEQQVLVEELQTEQAFLEKQNVIFCCKSQRYSYLEQMLQSVQVQVCLVYIVPSNCICSSIINSKFYL